MVLRILQLLKKNLVWSIPATMLAGLVLGQLFDLRSLAVTILPLTMLMIYPMMVGLNVRSVLDRGGWGVQGATQLINLVVIPLIAFGIGQLFLRQQPVFAFGLLLIGLLPTSGMTISWTGFAKGNVQAAVRMTVFGLVLGAVITPLYGNALMGQTVEVPLIKTFTQIGLVVFLPLVAGMATQWLLKRRYGAARFKEQIKPKFPLLSTLGVLGIIFVAMALKARSIIAQPSVVLSLLIPVLLFYAANYAIAAIAGRVLFQRRNAVALVYGSVMRNLSVALAIALTVFGKDQGAEMALIISAAFIVQVQSAAWFVKLAHKLFPQAPAEVPSEAAAAGA